MLRLFSLIDSLLRGEVVSRESLLRGRIETSARVLTLCAVLLGILYGVCMGLYGVARPENASGRQLLATTLKVPALFLLTLVVTFPSLYVFSALARSRLRFTSNLRLLLAGIVVNLALVASFGPVTGFFTFTTESYPFMIVLNVAFFTVGGVAGLLFMYKALQVVVTTDDANEKAESSPAQAPANAESPSPGTPEAAAPDKKLSPPSGAEESQAATKWIFCCWTVIYGCVGAQMGWILRPFIGSPDLPFEWFRERQSHFFKAIFDTLGRLF